MDKEVVVHIHDGILLSHKKNTFDVVLMRWMNLEPIIQSEVSQKEKDKYHILTHIYMESRRTVPRNLFSGQQWRNRHREWTNGHGERGGEGETYGESNVETYITLCKIDSQWEFAVCLRELKQGFYINLEGWGGKLEGGFKRRGHLYTYD